MKSVFSNVLNELLQRIQNGGYIAEVVSPSLLDDYSPKDQQVIVSATNFTENPELGCQGNPPAVAFDASVNLTCILRQGKNDASNIEERLSDFSSSVVQAVCGVDHWWTMGGNAIDTKVLAIDKEVESDGSTASHTISLNIIYRHSENNPFIRR